MAQNNDPVERLKRLSEHVLAESAHRALSRAQAAAENRRRFPVAAEALDRLAIFSPKLLYARQGDDEIGTPVDLSLAVKPGIPWREDSGCNPVSKNKGRKP